MCLWVIGWQVKELFIKFATFFKTFLDSTELLHIRFSVDYKNVYIK